jgi:hypothetical protein
LKTFAVSLVIAAEIVVANAQDHLEAEPAVLSDRDAYYSKVREVFTPAYRPEVILRIVIAPSSIPEEVAGIRRTVDGYQAFAVTSESAVWDTYFILTARPSGNVLRELKRRAPSDYREIVTHVYSAPISLKIVQRLVQIWHKMLLNTRKPTDGRIGLDGTTYRFDLLSIKGNSAEVWSPKKGTKALALVQIGIALSKYARHQLSEKELTRTLQAFE